MLRYLIKFLILYSTIVDILAQSSLTNNYLKIASNSAAKMKRSEQLGVAGRNLYLLYQHPFSYYGIASYVSQQLFCTF